MFPLQAVGEAEWRSQIIILADSKDYFINFIYSSLLPPRMHVVCRVYMQQFNMSVQCNKLQLIWTGYMGQGTECTI